METRLMSHDPSEIILICWFGAQETFFIISAENSCAASFFLLSPFDSFNASLLNKSTNYFFYIKFTDPYPLNSSVFKICRLYGFIFYLEIVNV